MSNPNNQGNTSTLKQPIKLKFDNIHSVKLGNEVIYQVAGSKLFTSYKSPKIAQEITSDLTLHYLKLTQSINDHTRIILGFKNLTPEQRDKYLNMADDKTPIIIKYIDPNEKPIDNEGPKSKTFFQGVVTKIASRLEKSLYYLEISGVSLTIELDQQKKTRSFSRPTLKYADLLKQIENEYPQAVISDFTIGEQQLGTFILQYQETDWQFLKRIAAKFGTGLTVNYTSEKPNLSIGVPESNGITQINLSKPKKSNVLKCIAKNTYNYDYTYEDDTKLQYQLIIENYLNIGDPVSLKKDEKKDQQQDQTNPLLYVVRSVGTIIDGSDLNWEHTLTPELGLTKMWYPNQKIAGVSLEGVVKDRIKDKALVELKIDIDHGGAAKDQYNPIRPYNENTYLEEFWYFSCATPYTAEGNTGWYCMPEIGDTVMVHFPTEYPTEAYIAQSIRKQSGDTPNLKLDQPNVKIFRTKFGKEIRFDPKELKITIQKYVPKQNNQPARVESPELIVLKLNDTDGVSLITDLPVNISSKNDLTIVSHEGNVNITAGAELNIACKDSSIAMKDGNTHVKGKRVKTN